MEENAGITHWDNNQKDIVIPAPTTNHATFPPPRHVVDIPSTEPTTPPESTGGVIVSFGDPEPRDGEWSYVVKKGDVLWNIAQNELGGGTRMQEISLLNNLANPDDLKIGQTLRMPSRQHRTSNSPGTIQNSGAATASGGREYIVRQGETLGLIAINELGSFARWPEIQRLNNLPNDKVMEGQKIRLPDRQSTTNMSSSNTVPADGRLYEVKGGETLWVIAQREFGDPYRWPEIQHLNNLPTEKVLKGQIIRLPNR